MSGKVRIDYIWVASIVETCLRMMIDLWDIRNEEVHDKYKTTKQQKRKAKAAISVRSLHDLQEQPRPIDLFLFYLDVEEEIEHAMAAKLEKFIVMKTRPIHNSVSKWAEQGTSKIKSIVEWIKAGKFIHRSIRKTREKI